MLTFDLLRTLFMGGLITPRLLMHSILMSLAVAVHSNTLPLEAPTPVSEVLMARLVVVGQRQAPLQGIRRPMLDLILQTFLIRRIRELIPISTVDEV